MRKKNNAVKMPTSKFARVQCKKCRNEQIVFTKSAKEVKCLKCDEVLVIPTGGESFIKAKILEVFG